MGYICGSIREHTHEDPMATNDLPTPPTVAPPGFDLRTFAPSW